MRAKTTAATNQITSESPRISYHGILDCTRYTGARTERAPGGVSGRGRSADEPAHEDSRADRERCRERRHAQLDAQVLPLGPDEREYAPGRDGEAEQRQREEEPGAVDRDRLDGAGPVARVPRRGPGGGAWFTPPAVPSPAWWPRRTLVGSRMAAWSGCAATQAPYDAPRDVSQALRSWAEVNTRSAQTTEVGLASGGAIGLALWSFQATTIHGTAQSTRTATTVRRLTLPGMSRSVARACGLTSSGAGPRGRPRADEGRSGGRVLTGRAGRLARRARRRGTRDGARRRRCRRSR